MVCTKCKVDRPDVDFYKYKGKNRSRCKICIKTATVMRERIKFNRTPSNFKDKSRIVLSIQNDITPRQIVSNCEIDIYKDNPEYRKCSDCNEVKELNETNFRKNCGERRYYSNRCDECQKYIDKIYAQTKRDEEKAQKELQYSTNPDYKKCVMCDKYKPLTDFYKNNKSLYYHTRCKRCHIEFTNKKQSEYYQKKFETCGGSERVIPKPNKYVDRWQEEQTKWVLELMGWNKEGDVWVKEGIKKVVAGKIVWDKIPTKEKIFKIKSKVELTGDDINKIKELRSSGLLIREIAVLYKCSKTTIRRILLYEKES